MEKPSKILQHLFTLIVKIRSKYIIPDLIEVSASEDLVILRNPSMTSKRLLILKEKRHHVIITWVYLILKMKNLMKQYSISIRLFSMILIVLATITIVDWQISITIDLKMQKQISTLPIK